MYQELDIYSAKLKERIEKLLSKVDRNKGLIAHLHRQNYELNAEVEQLEKEHERLRDLREVPPEAQPDDINDLPKSQQNEVKAALKDHAKNLAADAIEKVDELRKLLAGSEWSVGFHHRDRKTGQLIVKVSHSELPDKTNAQAKQTVLAPVLKSLVKWYQWQLDEGMPIAAHLDLKWAFPSVFGLLDGGDWVMQGNKMVWRKPQGP